MTSTTTQRAPRFPSWCKWHQSNGTCVEHRSCEICGKPPVFQDTDGLAYCINHAVWDSKEQRWR